MWRAVPFHLTAHTMPGFRESDPEFNRLTRDLRGLS